jgi:prepilin-type N-terminal cleavage/methylation domain-containing protein
MSKQQGGFTIIELMIATMVFAVILLGATTALFQLEKMYYRGIITARAQTTSRTVMASISQQLQFSQNVFTRAPKVTSYADKLEVQGFCIGTTRYSYVINGQVEEGAGYEAANHQIAHGLWRDTISPTAACVPLDLTRANPEQTPAYQASPGSAGSELLQQNMRLGVLDVNCPDDGSLCKIDLNIIYGDDDLLAPDAVNPVGCRSTFGDQWCATSHLSTHVFKRLQKDVAS